MKNILFLFAVLSLNIFTFNSSAQAEDHEHSIEVCSAIDQTVCAHLGYKWGPLNTTSEGQFIVHAMTPNNSELSNLAVELWMEMGDHGHGSSPVTLTKVRPNIYKVTEAYFVMEGEWLVKINFDLNGVNHTLEIPVQVVE
ncbi:MAG TPA: FixH family protein [Pseudobdellovibrionaceae bacterium]|nr:FixH family protein [Pseudobdellovibrionaceae bacterium]